MDKASGKLVKEINLNHVRHTLSDVETATKAQLAEETGLSVVTINALIKELVTRGEVFKEDTVPSGGGRPAATYRFNANYRLALVMLLKEHKGADVLMASVVNLNGETVRREEHFIPLFDHHCLDERIHVFLNAYPAIQVIGVGIPGQIVDGAIAVSSHQKLKGVRLIEHLEKTFKLTVLVENDVNAAVSGYCAQEIYEESDCVVGVYFPDNYPPGMGIQLNGDIVKGKNGMAGEIKFLPIDVDWEKNINKKEFVNIVCQIVQTVNAILAPNQIILYQSHIQQKEWDRLWQGYQKNYPSISEPNIVVSNSFQSDFNEGMKALTLKKVES